MRAYAVVVLLVVAYWFIGGMVLYTDGLVKVTGAAKWGVGGGNISHVMAACGLFTACWTVVYVRRIQGARRRRIFVATAGSLLALFVAATPWLLEYIGATSNVYRARTRAHAADRLASARDLSLARTRVAVGPLRRMLDSGDPIIAFEAAYGLALLGRRDARVNETFLETGDLVHDSEEVLTQPVDGVMICELFAVTRDEWPRQGTMPKNTWATTDDFRREWPEARKRFGATTLLLADRLDAIAGEVDARVPALLDVLDDAAERALTELPPAAVARAIANALRAFPPAERRHRLERLGRAILRA